MCLPINLQQLQAGDKGTHREVADFIRHQALFYGRKGKEPTQFQEKVNKAAQKLALSNPDLLHDRQLLLDSACARINDSGYQYKKGKS